MDRSFENIKMCEKATEIQKLNSFQEGNFYWCDGCGTGVAYYDRSGIFGGSEKGYIDYGHGVRERPNPYTVWLPRQDQLQKISGLTWQDFDLACLKYNTDTKEQAGCCVVMKEKYNKVWSGEDGISN